MKLGFVFDTKFKKHRDNYYSTNLSSGFLTKRYLKYFDEMVIVGRHESISEQSINKYSQSNSEKIEFRTIKNENPIKRIIHFKKDSEYIKAALRDCDAIVCRGWRGTRISRSIKKPYLVEVVNCAWDAYWNHGILGKIVAPIMYTLRRISTRNAPYVLYVTESFLQNRYPTNGQSVSISDVNLEDIDNKILENRIIKIDNKSIEEKIIIGTAAAVDVPYKGQQYVMSAISKLKKEGFNNFEYQIAGTGDSTRLKKLAKKLGIEDQIIFVGSIPHDMIFQWYDSLDIYIQPSLQEGLPRALIEAMSRGVLCYGARTGGIPELLLDECICKSNLILRREIARFLLKYDKNEAKKHAIRNIEESKKYASDLLESKWEQFFKSFYEVAKG